MQSLTTTDLIDAVRSLTDEDNRASLSDEVDILPALNRAQDFGADILARQYESPLLSYTDVDLITGQTDYNIPEDAFEDRVEKLEVNINGSFYPIERISYRDGTSYTNTGNVNVPNYYSIVGKTIKVYPSPTGAYSVRIWYLKEPSPLVKPQGRITLINAASNYIILDDVGADLTTSIDELNSYVNFIDAQTGLLKVSMQIQSINGSKVTFKSTPTRTSVLNKTIDTTLVSQGIEVDDYVCVIKGTCVPFYKKPLSNFMIQYAVAEIQRKLGGAADLEEQILAKFEKQVERTWVGRETTLRVQPRSSYWVKRARRFFRGS